MATGKITKATVERLKGGEWIWDASVKGFGARRQRDGVFYYLRYRLGGVQRMKSIRAARLALDSRILRVGRRRLR